MLGRRYGEARHLGAVVAAGGDETLDRVGAHEIDEMGAAAECSLLAAGDAAAAEVVQLERDLPVRVVARPLQAGVDDLLGVPGHGSDRRWIPDRPKQIGRASWRARENIAVR